MDSLTVLSSGRRPAGLGRVLGLLLPCCLLFLTSAGCVTLGTLVPSMHAPPTPVCQVVATWTNEVAWTPDPTHNGKPLPGFAGRLYLFGPEIDFPLTVDGTVVVDLLDDTKQDAEGQPVLVERWHIDPVTLKRLKRRDAIGWGYTLFLPWSTYRPEVNHVQLKLRFEPAAGGTPLYATGSALTLGGNEAGPFLAGRGPNAPPGTATARRTPLIGPTPPTTGTAAPVLTARPGTLP